MTHSTASKGLIIGGGIAGLGAAIFAKQQGLDVELFERSTEVSSDEHLLWIAPNGLHLLHKLGLTYAVMEASTPQEAMIFADRNLRPLMTLTGTALRRSCDFPIVALKRRDLWHALYARLLALGGHVHFGRTLDHLKVETGRVLVHFSESEMPRSVQWVIGADGMGSKVRNAFAPESKVVYQGLRTWLGSSETPLAARYVGQTIEAWGKGTRFVLTSLDGRTVHFSALERAAGYEPNNAPIPDDTLPRLKRLFSDYHPDVYGILDAANPDSLLRCNFGVVSGLSQPYHGPLAVIGDAFHGMPPNMGQGASLGLEDALWITQKLVQSDRSETAFRAYAIGRKKRVDEMRFLANAMNGLFQPQSTLGGLLRNFVAGLIPDALTARRMGQLYQPALPR